MGNPRGAESKSASSAASPKNRVRLHQNLREKERERERFVMILFFFSFFLFCLTCNLQLPRQSLLDAIPKDMGRPWEDQGCRDAIFAAAIKTTPSLAGSKT